MTLYKYGCSLRAKGWGDDDELGKELRRANVEHCTTPLSDGELTELIKQVCKRSVGEPKKKVRPAATDKLLEYLNETKLWHTEDKRTYVTIERDGHQENYETNSKLFNEWLNWSYWKDRKKTVPPWALKQAIETATAKAQFEGKLQKVWLRVARVGEKIYLDLGDDTWRAVEIGVNGWRMVARPPVKFRRGGGTALPVPVQNSDIEELREYLNLTDDGDFKLVVGWLVACFRPDLPVLILQLNGEAGTAKTTALRICRDLVDPAKAAGRGLPSKEDDLMVTAHNNWIVSGDNISHVTADMADALCRLTTGGGSSKRLLYSDGAEYCIDVKRPVALTGINIVSQRQDLVGRMLQVKLEPIDETKRREEAELLEAFEEARPRILGALLDGVSMALRRVDDVKLAHLPRMADFAKWAEAAGPAFGWDEFEFIDAYAKMRNDAMDQAVESDVVSNAISQLIADRGEEWTGSTTDLLTDLGIFVSYEVTQQKYWPPDATRLSKRMNKIAPGLRAIGIGVKSEKDTTSNKTVWTITPKQKPQLEIEC